MLSPCGTPSCSQQTRSGAHLHPNPVPFSLVQVQLHCSGPRIIQIAAQIERVVLWATPPSSKIIHKKDLITVRRSEAGEMYRRGNKLERYTIAALCWISEETAADLMGLFFFFLPFVKTTSAL